MRLYKLTRTDKCPVDWDQSNGFIVRAARELVFSTCWDYDKKVVWLDSELTKCEEISIDGDEEVLLHDFNAG